ncbi:hypothetical protein [Okeania sp. SIO2B3]|uniref:hypothetical protein n=1 Tax=Okeania sp. SIO2B3 TaxID=2607784 RepID=UPI0013C1EF86|nr:hypothetical protein [Okeania sp. SIO2B3]NET40583.1 hypothetical protein [Okeania sp. SIO2B3]
MAIQFESPRLEAAVEKVYSRLGDLELGKLEVRIPALESGDVSMPKLVVGEGEMKYVLFDNETEIQYPPELQPQFTPDESTFYWHQIKHPERFFHIYGEFVSLGTPQIAPAILSTYNADNGTSFGERPIDKIITPIRNSSGQDVPLVFSCESDWVNSSNGNVVTHVEPLFAVWRKNSKEIELKFDKATYSVPFGTGLVWNIKMSFWAAATLDLPDMEEAD